ncbi:hypothetical protein E8E14_002298 [Neopestalotiopsis sp. 37M]|nr:hypothetical protein E8E14_002298 [Neopestalotiopsis sp. 37M]
MGSVSRDRAVDPSDISGSVATASDERLRRTKSERVKGERDSRDRSRERTRDKDRDREHRHRSSHKTKSRSSKMAADGESQTSTTPHRRHRTEEEKQRHRERKEEREREREERKKNSSMSDLVPEMSRSSLQSSRVSLPYPSFSKAHSKEDVSAVRQAEREPPTPEPTDLGPKPSRRSKSPKRSGSSASSTRKASVKKENRPPSPPETEMSEDKRQSRTSTPRTRDSDDRAADRPDSRTSGISRSSSRRDDKSKLSTKSKASSQATYIKSSGRPPPGVHIMDDEDSSIVSDDKTAGARSAATSILPKRMDSKRSRRSDPLDDDSPDSVQDSSPKTPTVTTQFPPPPPMFSHEKQPSPLMFMADDRPTDRPTPSATPMSDFGAPPPPPPPPPPLNIQEVPRIDYLLQNGGLMQPIPKSFLSALPRPNGTRPSNPPLAGSDVLFAPFYDLLSKYQTVLHKQGSVAVATGHRSVARRLLDRLEDVFSRDLPEEGCHCVMCQQRPDEHHGLGWGEVLERVGGRVEMPSWPPFDLADMSEATINHVRHEPPRPASPVQLDPDIAEEFRDHYLRQSKKVKSAVDKWMNTCNEAPAPPPSDIDDETLTFAILTSLKTEDRPYFNALLAGSRDLDLNVRAPTPNVRKPRAEFVVKMGLALQRLYRLAQPPRDAETACYLVKNKYHHDVLVTIDDISSQEWEILTSGRFDGFLWSGADDDGITPTAEYPRGATPASGFFSPPASRPGTGMSRHAGGGASRNTTPFSGVYSRGATPASFISLNSTATQGQSRQAVSHDEELEIAVLNDVEREIYQGMEALEDAFEKLHHQAEMVRNALRERNAGLMMRMQQRRAGRIDVLPQSGDSMNGYERPYWATGEDETSESDWGGDDLDSLAPDDSASNISSSRHRRPKRRTERRTPAPIEEDDEEN